jgi:hypothetical protein
MQLVQRLQEDHQLLVSDQTVRRRLHGDFLGLGSIYHGVTNNGLWYCSLMSPVSGFIRIHVEHELGELQEELAVYGTVILKFCKITYHSSIYKIRKFFIEF